MKLSKFYYVILFFVISCNQDNDRFAIVIHGGAGTILKKNMSDEMEKEFGVIPMTCHPFDNSNTDRILNIGTAGGWTKPSSGYTFKYIDKNTDKLIVSLKNNISFSKISFKSRHWIYDLILLDVLFFKNYMGSVLFTKMFSKNSIKKIFSFLDNESSFIEELKIASSFPKVIFTKSLLRNLGKILKYYL